MDTIKLLLFGLFLINLSFSQWIRITPNIDTYSLTYSGNKMFAGTYDKGVYYSSNNGANWVQTSLNSRDVRSLACIGNYVIAGTRGNGIYYSTNNGTSWVQTNLVSEKVWSLAIIGNNIFAGTDDKGVYFSVNNGVTWSQTSMNNKDVNYLYPVGTVLFAAVGADGWGVFITPDNGVTWTELGEINVATYSVAVSGNYIYAGPYYSGVNVSTDFGVSWIQTSFDNGTAAALAVSGNNVFAGTEGFGFKVSNDNGTTWSSRSEGMGSGYISALMIINNYIYAGTGSGVYKRPLSEIIGLHQISAEVPESYSLYQNYPNPFNPSTTIKFEIPNARLSFGQSLEVGLKIYDVLGNEIAVLVNSKLTPGTYEYQWDASNYPSGVYFYKLSAGDYTAVNKMILIK